MDTQPKCPSCGRPLAPNAPLGLCAECLMHCAFPTGGDTASGNPAPPKPPRFVPPKPEELAPLFPQLEILEFIGQGGMGAVYRARQKQLGRMVALKILPPEVAGGAGFAERFTREARALASLSHPNIVTLYEFGQADGLYFFLMELVDGVNLQELLRAGRIAPREALAIVPQICDALQFAHDLGIVHRDIKPGNILLNRRGQVKIADFGIAKMLDPEAGRADLPVSPEIGAAPPHDPTGIIGTPGYSAPEQKSDPQHVDCRADIYSLGVVFYEMLTGELPGQRIEAPSRKVHIDVRLDEVVLRAMEKKPELRYQQVSEVKTMVETIAATGSGDIPPAEASAAPALARNSLRFFDFTIGMPQMVEREGRARFYWPGVLLLCSTIGFAVCGFNLTIALAMWLLNVTLPHGNTFINPGELWLWFVWMAFCAVGRLVALNLGSSAAVRASFPGTKTVRAILIVAVSAAWAYGLASFAGWMRAESTAVLADSGFRVMAWIALTVAVGLFIRRNWRAMNKSAAALGAVLIVLGILGLVTFVHLGNGSLMDRLQKGMSLADRPDKLRSASTEAVIQAGLDKPQQPWAWQELDGRVRSLRLSTNEADKIVDGLAAWMRRDYPNGYDQPLNWLGNFLGLLDKAHLVAETNALAFLDAYCGSLFIEPLSRAREAERVIRLKFNLRNTWFSALFGLEFLNEVRSISIDDQPVLLRNDFGRNWNTQQFTGDLPVLGLAPGKHIVRCEVLSALVYATNMAGLAQDAPSTDWPPAERRWTRSCQAEFTVYATNAEIVSLSEDPALDPVASGALSLWQVIIRPRGGSLTAFLEFIPKPSPGLPISVDVTLRLAGQTINCGTMWAEAIANGMSKSGGTLSADIGPLEPQIKEAEIVLTPNPKAVESHPGIGRIWGKEIVFRHVLLSRQDLAGAPPVETTGSK